MLVVVLYNLVNLSIFLFEKKKMEAGLKRKAPTTTSTPNPTLNTLESTRPTSSNVSEVVEVDSESFTKSLWLVKLPRYIAEKWKDAKNDDILGTFMVGTTPGSKPGEPPKKQMIVKLKQEDTDKGKTGDVYFLDELRKIDENEECKYNFLKFILYSLYKIYFSFIQLFWLFQTIQLILVVKLLVV